jgi:hypothetical protein
MILEALIEPAGEAGEYLAEAMGRQASEAIDGLPASTPHQRQAIALAVAAELVAYAYQVTT